MNKKAHSNAYKIVMISAVFFLSASFGVFADTTGTLTLQGYVPEILDITVTPTGNQTGLDLSIDETDVEVATVVERSNKKTGYTVTLESANNGNFAGLDAGNTDVLPYTLSYDGTSVDLSGGSAVITDEDGKSSGGRNGASRSVSISYTGSGELLYEDDYEDILTFTIAAK